MPRVRFAIGVSPDNAASYTDDVDELIRQTARDKRKHVVAIGRCGLSERRDEVQVRAFERQAALACELDLPLIVDASGSCASMLDSLKAHGLPKWGVLLSGFGGTPEELDAWCEAGAWVSFDVRAADDPAMFSKLAQIVPEDRLLVESGAPQRAAGKLAGYDARADQVVFVADALMGCAGPGVLAANFRSLFDGSL